MLKLKISFLLLLSVVATNLMAQSKQPQKVTSVEGITEYRLDNGLRVLLFPDPSKQTITVNVTYLVGSKHENYGETGMAHLLEHLVFKGTPKHTNIPQELTEHGARPNGTTWLDRTNYFETFNATDENLKWALDLEADRMVNSFIAKKDLDSEMTVVRNEFESGENSPFRVLLQRMMATAYEWHNYGKSTIGSKADLENVPIDRLQAFYKNYYQPDNAVLTVAGKFDEAKTLAMIQEYFGAIPKPTRQLAKFYTKDPVQDGERVVTLRRVGDVQLVGVVYHVAPGSHADFAGVDMTIRTLGAEGTGRLSKALVDTKKASSVYAFPFQMRDPSTAIFLAEVRKEQNLEEVKKIMLETIDGIAKNPPTAEEIERAKNEALKELELQFNSSQNVCLELSEWIGMGDWRLVFLNRDRIKAVNVESVKKVAQNYFKPDNRTVGLFIPTEKPERAEIPDVPNVEELVKDYKGGQVMAQGEAFDPSCQNIDSRTKKSKLSNGMQLALLSKKTRGESVNVNITLRFGDEKSVMGKGTAAQMLTSMLDKGTKKRTREQIKDQLDKLKARVFIYSAFGGATNAMLSIETTRPNLKAVMDLVNEMLKESVLPETEFEKLKEEQLSGIEQQKSEPTSQAFLRYQRHTSPYQKGDPRYTGTIEEQIEDIKNLKLDEVKSFYKEFLGSSEASTMAVVGDFDEKEVSKIAEATFGKWKSPKKYVRMPSVYKDAQAINEKIETPDKANAFFLAGLNLQIQEDDADYAALTLGNFMLGGGFLNSRLAVRIRQKEGLSYGVGSRFSAGSMDKAGSFTANAIYAPQNLEKLEAAFQEEIQKVVTEGFTAEEVAAAKSGWLQGRVVSRSQDNQLVGTLNNYLFLNRTMKWDEELDKKVQALTPDQIKEAMKRHIKAEKFVIIKAGDFKKAAEQKTDGK